MSSTPPVGCRPMRAGMFLLLTASVLWVAAAGSRAGAGPGTGRDLPGQIPKAPHWLAGFPIPFPRPADYRGAGGALLTADLDGDGRPEIVVSLPTGFVTALRGDGSVMPGWPRTFAGLPAPAWPIGGVAAGDVDGDGRSEVVTCVAAGESPRRYFLAAIRSDGTDLPGWPVDLRSPNGQDRACAPGAPLLADVDGCGRPEVIRALGAGEIAAYSADGRPVPGWPHDVGPDAFGRRRAINADLAAADLDRDGRPDLIFVESGFEPRLGAIAGSGRRLPGYPVVLPEVVDRQAPIAADLDGDGLPELAQATLPFEGAVAALPYGTRGHTAAPAPAVPAALHVLTSAGAAAPGWPITMTSGGPWGPVAADLDGDGTPELLQQDGNLLCAFDASGAGVPGFPLSPHRDFVSAEALQFSPWSVVDLDGDTRPDLLQARADLYGGTWYLRVFAVSLTGRSLRGFPFDAGDLALVAGPITADLDADGSLDLLILAGGGSASGYSLLGWNLASPRR